MLFQPGLIEFFTGSKGFIELNTGNHVFQPAFIQGLPLAGLYKFKLSDDVGITIYFEFQPFSQISAFKHMPLPNKLIAFFSQVNGFINSCKTIEQTPCLIHASLHA